MRNHPLEYERPERITPPAQPDVAKRLEHILAQTPTPPDLAERLERILAQLGTAQKPEEIAAITVSLVETLEAAPSSDLLIAIAQAQMLAAILRELVDLRTAVDALRGTA